MFDIKKRKAEKLKIVEILLIIGGIIGGIRASGTDFTMLGIFLSSSLFYYFMVSRFEYDKTKPPNSAFLFFSVFIAISFSLLLNQIFAVSDLGIQTSTQIFLIIIFAIAVFINLYL